MTPYGFNLRPVVMVDPNEKNHIGDWMGYTICVLMLILQIVILVSGIFQIKLP